MIDSLEIENFKCFSGLRVRLGGLTLLTGFNASGKSSALQPLLLLAQALKMSITTTQLTLNGPLVRLGTVGDVLPANSVQASVVFKVADTFNEVTWHTSSRAGERHFDVSNLNSRTLIDSSESGVDTTVLDRSNPILSALADLSYLSAVREGAADVFPLPEIAVQVAPDVGADGRFAAYWYDVFVDDEVPLARRCPGESAGSLRKQLDAWFATLFPGAQVNVQHIAQASLECLQFRLNDIGTWRRPANVGYGFTYAFPVLVALLTASQGQLIVIDSPEAHLHPFAQSQMGRMLAHFAAAGVQVVVETHSDHLLNGVRLAVKGGVISHNQVRTHFFEGASDTGHGVRTLSIDRDGRINDWPEGFFDQSEKDLARLTGWA